MLGNAIIEVEFDKYEDDITEEWTNRKDKKMYHIVSEHAERWLFGKIVGNLIPL